MEKPDTQAEHVEQVRCRTRGPNEVELRCGCAWMRMGHKGVRGQEEVPSASRRGVWGVPPQPIRSRRVLARLPELPSPPRERSSVKEILPHPDPVVARALEHNAALEWAAEGEIRSSLTVGRR